MTGALSGMAKGDAEVLAVDGVPDKLHRAFDTGCRRVFIPMGNAGEFSGSPALQHAAQAAKAEVRPTAALKEVCEQLFPPSGTGTARALLIDTLKQAAHILRPSRRLDHAAIRAAPPHRVHLLVSVGFLAGIFLLEGFKHHLAYAGDYPAGLATVRTLAATLAVSAGLLFSYGLILAFLHHRKSWAWLASLAIMAVAMAAAVMILGTMLPRATDISAKNDWPVWASLIKDAFVMWLFAWILLTNTFAVVSGLEHLIGRRQFITARRCLAWDSFLEGRMPVRAVHFPWSWGVLAFFVVGVLLFILEFLYYASLREGLAATYWETFLGISRDMVLIAAVAESMVFYKVALAGWAGRGPSPGVRRRPAACPCLLELGPADDPADG